MRLRSNEMAAAALRHVLAVQKETTKDLKAREDYQQLWMKFPMLVMRNGLVQTLAFYMSKAKDQKGEFKAEYTYFFEHYFRSTGLWETERSVPACYKKLLQEVELSSYLQHSERALEVATWYKRFCESQFSSTPTTSTQENG